jgi:hypothetical protein
VQRIWVSMSDIKVAITDRDSYVGGMLRGLARKVCGQNAVKGATDEFLSKHGFCVFRFVNHDKAAEFSDAVHEYIPESLAKVIQ